ncbi:putative F-box protein PP2-B12 [Mangifera indica]|uniref:putative F-box protein PP2-B12 n=1 Tax=Mangifera indica TaxID=29780 RepID=UPI001CFBD8CF|nr:putative F-box protein PP2-B12 [Mangifera indica]
MNSLPEGCIADITCCTTPRDACRLSLVSSLFKSAAESDAVWERFLPPDYQSIISNSCPCPSSSSSPPSLLCLPSKKQLFLSLCDHPILIDGGKKAFYLDKQSGKKCYMISARELMIVGGDTPRYWAWSSLPGRGLFQEAAELIEMYTLEIRGKISTCILTPGTHYTAFLVFKLTERSYGFYSPPVEVSVGLVKSESQKRYVYLYVVIGQDDHHPRERRDKWLEVELGDFYNAGHGDDELEISILEVKGGWWKSGLIVQGIEIRPISGTKIYTERGSP